MQINLLFLVFYPIAGAFLAYAVGRKNKKARDFTADFIAASECLLLVMQLMPFLTGNAAAGSSLVKLPGVGGLGLSFVMDGFRGLYATVAAFMWLVCTAFSREYFCHHRNRNRYIFFLLTTLGAVMGVFLSGDLYTTFLFFELASFTSYMWVVQEENQKALKAGETYLAIAVIGGLVMLMGLFLLFDAVGTLEMAALRTACAEHAGSSRMVAAGVCLFFGFAAKAGAVPLHVWLPKAHPAAPAPASALLSGILTKVGIFGILVVSSQIFFRDAKWGTLVLVIGVLTMLTGAVEALLSMDLKQVLACSSISQIGFILIGIGMQGLLGEQNQTAVRGTLLYMINHSLFKLVLFLAAGVIVMNIHKLELNEIRGYGRKKPLLNGIFLFGAMGISGLPLFSGYIGKTLLHESIVEYVRMLSEGEIQAVLFGLPAVKLVEWLFLLGGGFTVAYMIKLYTVLFIEKNIEPEVQKKYDEQKAYLGFGNGLLLSLISLLFLIMGIFPHQTMDVFADVGQGFMNADGAFEEMRYFSLSNVSGSLISLGIGVAVYFLLIRGLLMKREKTAEGKKTAVYVSRNKEEWELENVVYRPLLWRLELLCSIVFRCCDRFPDYMIVALRKSIYRDSLLPHELEEGTAVTHTLGRLLDDIKEMLNHTLRRKRPIKGSFEHRLALINEELAENNTIIARSLSFGLFMFCIGLVLTLVYMLWG